MNVIGFAFAEHFDPGPIDAIVFDGVLQHGKRLIALVGQQCAAFQFLPIKGGVGLAGGQKEAVTLIDLGEVDRQRLDPAFPRLPVRGDRGLDHVDGAVAN